MTPPSIPGSVADLTQSREDFAADLETAIVAVGFAWRAFERVTQALGDLVGEDLQRRLEVPIAMHLNRAGLSEFLERKLVGAPGALQAIVREQHDRLALRDRTPH